ncbi:MAG: GDP-L-fucose synthase [Planctomycetota bacterium]|nr:GDP-L-fucose synthase [Planctomycetota bacterium]MDA1106127.1 GDP-L-fucose synthase [Planctomycetota bacterium]
MSTPAAPEPRPGPIYVAGHRGMVGSAICRVLRASGRDDLLLRTHAELDLTNQSAVESLFERERPEQVYLAAARVGGIHANSTYPAQFIYENLVMECHVIHAAWKHGVKRLLFLGSSCIYPRLADQPMREEALLTGKLESTNEPYAIAKIAGIKLCESYNRQHGCDFRSVMPTNLYGPGDNYHAENSHVIPALMRRFHDAKLAGAPEVMIWGTGTPRREFLFVDDMAQACVFVMGLPRTAYDAETKPMESHINVGSGTDVTIAELAGAIARVVGYKGRMSYDASRPDGTPRKLMDVARLSRLGFCSNTSLESGLKLAYQEFCEGDVRSL